MDTLTFQNRSLRDRAKRFEEALRKSTDEQIVVTYALYRTGQYVACLGDSSCIQLKGSIVALVLKTDSGLD